MALIPVNAFSTSNFSLYTQDWNALLEEEKEIGTEPQLLNQLRLTTGQVRLT